MALGTAVATDIANAALVFYLKGKPFQQTIQDKPLLRHLYANKQAFPGGKDSISLGVQGVFMNSVAGFFAGYSEDDAVVFKQAQNMLRAQFDWKELHAGLIITETELKKDGVSVSDDMKTSEHSQTEIHRLTSLLANRLDDFGESWARSMNDMLWRDGTQDTKAIPGVTALLTNNPAVGTTGSLSRVTYAWWRHRSALDIESSEANQTLTKTLRTELHQLRRYGGKPSIALCGSRFIESLEKEIQAKGIYTQEGFRNEGKNDIGMAAIRLLGLGKFEYDPTLDDLGREEYCYVMDPKKLTLRPMEGEENKVRNPTRPYNYFVFLRSMTYTGALTVQQLNCHGVYSVFA